MGELPTAAIPTPHDISNRGVASRRVVERPDRHCGDDLVITIAAQDTTLSSSVKNTRWVLGVGLIDVGDGKLGTDDNRNHYSFIYYRFEEDGQCGRCF